MPTPLVSVLIPAFNAETSILETLRSILNQTHTNLEIIVVDDGSTDKSCLVVESLIDSRVRLIRQSNSGASKARNTAFLASKGEFIQFLDADDLISPDKIQIQLKRLERDRDCIASSAWARFVNTTEGASFRTRPSWRDCEPMDWLIAEWSSGGGMLFPAQWLVPRQVVLQAGFWDESLSLNDDGEYFTRIVLASKKVLFCGEVRAYYRSGNPGSLSQLKSLAGWQSQFRSIALCEKHAIAYENSLRVNDAVATLWHHLSHACYPYQRELAEEAIQRAKILSVVPLEPSGSTLFTLVCRIFGWKFARLIQNKYYRLRYKTY